MTWQHPIKKDAIVSYIEAQALSSIGIQRIGHGGSEVHWQRHFKYFYENDGDERIMLRRQSDNFDIYSTAQDIPYLDDIANKLEEKLAHYSSLFEFQVKHPFNCVIYPSSEAGDHCLIVSENYNGGSGWSGDKLDILSPVHFEGGLKEALDHLIPHEFFHVFHFNMVVHLFRLPGFHSEGMAEIMAYENDNDQYLNDRSWYFRDGLERFKQENGREPKLEDIIPDSDGYMSVYSYGQAFWHYMHQNHADYVKIKEFFTSGSNWDVFAAPYEEIDQGYINYLKELAGITPIDEVKRKCLEAWVEKGKLVIKNMETKNQELAIQLFNLGGQQLLLKEMDLLPNEKSTVAIPGKRNYPFLVLVISGKDGVYSQKLHYPVD